MLRGVALVLGAVPGALTLMAVKVNVEDARTERRAGFGGPDDGDGAANPQGVWGWECSGRGWRLSVMAMRARGYAAFSEAAWLQAH